ncbi:MAG: 3-oxoacyl-ACP reductase [Acidobacteria bacterium]|nr:MAG: 3-oxoacyl-ACP reductase [Acidobacteriota bacterium]
MATAFALIPEERPLQQPKPLQGKVALVTGAARGIGRAIAIELASLGAAVALNYRASSAEAEQLSSEIQEMGAKSILIQGDISSKEESKRVLEAVMDSFKQIDILVNNAGINRDRTLRKMTEKDWRDVVNTNLNGTFLCTRAALPAMIQRRFGRIVNIASVVGQAGAYGQANYAASKGAIIAFTKTVALEAAPFNITANVVAPGYTATDMVAGMPINVRREIESRIPLKRLAEPQEIAKAVAFLITDGGYITGHELNVNGGIYV